MKTINKQEELFEKITEGLKEVRAKLIEFKKQKKTEIVIIKNGKIVKIKPE